jgi:hypothetical protein
MKRNLLLGLVVAAVLSCSGRMILMAAHANSTEKNAFTPDTIPYGPAPALVAAGHSLPYWKGTQVLRAETIPCG